MKKIVRYFGVLLSVLLLSASFVQCGEDPNGGSTEKPGGEEPDDPDDPDALVGYPKGVTVKEFTDKLAEGVQCLGYYAVIDFQANPQLNFNPKFTAGRKPTQHFADFKTQGAGTPYIAINGGYFNSKLESLSLLVDRGTVESIALQDDYIWTTTPYQHFFPVRAALGRMADGTLEATWVYCVDDAHDAPYSFSSALDNNEQTQTFMTAAPTSQTAGGKLWQPRYAIGGGPMLVCGGKNVAVENYWKEIFDCGGIAGLSRQPRTAIGATADGKMVIIVCDGRQKRGSAGFTLAEMANKFISLGCVAAINLDGGGSSTFVGRDGKVLNMPSDTSGTTLEEAVIKERSVPTAVIISER